MADIRASQILAQVEYAIDIDTTIVADPIVVTISLLGTWGSVCFTDFSEYPTSQAPADWTERWDVAHAAYSVETGGKYGGKLLEVDVTGTGYPVISWDDVDSNADVDMLICFRRKGTSTNNEATQFVVRGVGVTPFHGYHLHLQTESGQQTLKLGRCISGSYSQVGSTVNISTYPGANEWTWCRFQCRGTALKGKLWSDGVTEPGAWQLEETDSGITAAGWSGVGHGCQSTYDYDVDYFAVGSGLSSPGVPVSVTADPIVLTTSILGTWESVVFVIADPLVLTISVFGDWEATVIVVADPIDVTISVLGSFAVSLFLEAEPIVVTVRQTGILSQWPARERDPALDQTFDCKYTDVHGNKNAGIPVISISLAGIWLNRTIFADPVIVTISQEGDWVAGILVAADPIIVTISLKDADVITELFKTNWVKWSDIGSLDFTIDRTNVAGERPLDWRGWVYSICKLGSKVVVYGENGVSILNPSGTYYGLQTVYRVGLKGKGAVSGDDSVHFFVDNLGQLWRFSEGLEKLDYSEYLSGMLDNLVLSWDAANKLLYICDGSQGYVYSQDSQSLGAGPVNVSGINSQSGSLYVVSPATIATPTFEICTDIYDLGTRKGKNIHSLEIGTDLTEALEAAIEYRIDKADDFAVTDWHVVDSRGFVYLPVHGREFRFKVKSDVYSYFEVDYITITGEACRH